MSTQLVNINTALSQPAVNLEEEVSPQYAAQVALFRAQPLRVQRMLEMQALLISKAIVERQSPLRFMLPDQVVCEENGQGEAGLVTVPANRREQKVGGFLDLLKSSDIDRHLKELEGSPEKAISTSGKVVRYAIACHMVYRMAPIPQPSRDQRSLCAYALNFLLPQWVALDDHDNLLVNSLEEARDCIAALRRSLWILEIAVWLAPYFRTDREFRRKYSGIRNQLTVQGRALARHQIGEIIRKIERRVAENSLNRGFSLSLPFFDDQAMEIKLLDIPVIPHGRIQFVPAFVVVAARLKELEIAHSQDLSSSTRDHLLEELRALAEAFDDQIKSISG